MDVLLTLQENKIKELEKELQQYKQMHQLQSTIPRTAAGDNVDSEANPALRKRTDDTSPWEPIVSLLAQELGEMKEEIAALKNANVQITTGSGSVFTRWGHSSCPSSTEMVYSGFAGGTMYDRGSAANMLCLPHTPALDDHPIPHYGAAEIYGAEYETCNEPSCQMSVACAVCRTPRISVLMLPAAKVCHAGWTLEYEGYLMAGHSGNAASEYVCVDRKLGYIEKTHSDENGKRLYYTAVHCNSLSCPPYVDNKIVPCCVCSK